MEVASTFGILAVAISVFLTSMTRMNRAAFAARLQTTAVALAQQKIDEALSVPWTSSDLSDRPTVLNPPSDDDTSIPGLTKTETNLPLNNDAALSNASDLKSAFTDLDLQVNAKRATSIVEVTPASGTVVRQLKISVLVTYTYRGRDYSVSLTTLRTSDFL